MAYILCIETSTTVCSVAIVQDGRLASLREVNAGYRHAENITVFIGQVCHESGIALNQLDAIAVSKGPGSYTGLRIGASTAKGLCYALQKPLLAIDTLKSLAGCYLQSPIKDFPSLLIPMLDARRMEVYCAVFDNALKEIRPPEAVVINENSFEGELMSGPVVFFGDGAEKCKPLFEKKSNALFAEVLLSATGMIPLAEEKFSRNEFEDVSLFEPFYLKEVVIGKSSQG